MTVFALIPAAGHSRRMGRPKLAMPLGNRSILEHVVAAVRAGGVEEVLVVISPATAFLGDMAERAGARVHVLPAETPDMRATVAAGLGILEEKFMAGPLDAWLLLPADHPTLHPSVIVRLLAAAREHAEKTIFVPTFAGKRGHPTLMRWSMVAAIRALPAGTGLNAAIRAAPDETMEIPWPTPEVLLDLDTPEDYEKLRS